MDARRDREARPMQNPTTMERKSERELVLTRTFNGPARIVFEAWTKPELLKRWWIPKSSGRYLRALVASRYQPQVREFYERLQKRGKNKLQALLAVARKLVHAISGMFRTLQPFDGTRLFAFAPAKTA